MTNTTRAAANILDNAERALRASCVSNPELMMRCILDEAMEWVGRGFVWDVALAKAVKIYPCTSFAAIGAYGG